jgi:hypothetical protein
MTTIGSKIVGSTLSESNQVKVVSENLQLKSLVVAGNENTDTTVEISAEARKKLANERPTVLGGGSGTEPPKAQGGGSGTEPPLEPGM